ncbi:Polycomb protein, VEFS-Box, partial [Dillenia turbinata]
MEKRIIFNDAGCLTPTCFLLNSIDPLNSASNYPVDPAFNNLTILYGHCADGFLLNTISSFCSTVQCLASTMTPKSTTDSTLNSSRSTHFESSTYTFHVTLCWRLFLIKLWNHGLLDGRAMNNCNIILERCQSE